MHVEAAGHLVTVHEHFETNWFYGSYSKQSGWACSARQARPKTIDQKQK